MISANNVTLRFGKKALFEDVNIKFVPGNCYGLIGANGAGKSTFLKILSGEIEPSKGDVTMDEGERLSVLQQDHYKFDEYTVLDTVIMGNKRLYEIMKEKDAIYAKEDFTDEDGIRASELEGEFADMNGWEAESDAETLLNGLGVDTEYHYMMMKDLDGGLKVKALLAQALFGNPDVLLLDEPTNHLDIYMRESLTQALAAYTGTLLLVTHDRYLMQPLGCPILYLEDGKATFYQNFQKLHDRDTSKQPEPAKQEDKPQKAGYGKEQRRRRAEVRTRLKALETEIEELGAHIVELENEINDPEVLRDHLLLRDKCDELDDSRFHQQELYDEWEKLAEEQDRMDAESDS